MLNSTKKSLVFVLFEKPFVIFGAFGNIYTQFLKENTPNVSKKQCASAKARGVSVGTKTQRTQ